MYDQPLHFKKQKNFIGLKACDVFEYNFLIFSHITCALQVVNILIITIIIIIIIIILNVIINVLLLRTTRGAYNPNLQVVITHASHVCSQHSFGLPLKMNEMNRTQFDHAPLDLLPLVI